MKELQESGEVLLNMYQAGDDNAFTELVLHYQDGLSSFINGIVKDKHETEHLTIETFARLAASKNNFAGRSSFKTYLYTIGKNIALRHLKTRGQQHLSFEEVTWMFADEGETPESSMERKENRQRLLDTINSLKEDYRDVLKLLYFEDMSYIQAGEVMQKNEMQIKNLAHRAKAALKKKLEADL